MSDPRADYMRAYYEANRERIREYQRAYRERNKDRLSEYERDRYAAERRDPEAIAAERSRLREWHRQNPTGHTAFTANHRARKAGVSGRVTAADVRAVMSTGVCAICKSPDQPTLDHIVPLSRGGANHRDNLQRLCAPCNSGKCDRLSA